MKRTMLACVVAIVCGTNLFAGTDAGVLEVSKAPMITGYALAGEGTVFLAYSALIWSDRTDPNTQGSVGSSMLLAFRALATPSCIIGGALWVTSTIFLCKYYSSKYSGNRKIGLTVGVDRVCLTYHF